MQFPTVSRKSNQTTTTHIPSPTCRLCVGSYRTYNLSSDTRPRHIDDVKIVRLRRRNQLCLNRSGSQSWLSSPTHSFFLISHHRVRSQFIGFIYILSGSPTIYTTFAQLHITLFWIIQSSTRGASSDFCNSKINRK